MFQKRHLLTPQKILKNLIGFSNIWLCLIWAIIYYYVCQKQILEKELQTCEELLFLSNVTKLIYFSIFVIKTIQQYFESKLDKYLSNLNNYLCVIVFLIGFYNFYIAFYIERQRCGVLNSLNRIHGILLFIYESLGLLFTFMVYVNNYEIQQKEKNKYKKVRYSE